MPRIGDIAKGMRLAGKGERPNEHQCSDCFRVNRTLVELKIIRKQVDESGYVYFIAVCPLSPEIHERSFFII